MSFFHRTTLAFPSLLIGACLALSGCSFGTEVGNGVRPTGKGGAGGGGGGGAGDNGPDTAASGAPDSSGQENTSTPAANGPVVASSSAGGGTAAGAGSAGNSAPTADGASGSGAKGAMSTGASGAGSAPTAATNATAAAPAVSASDLTAQVDRAFGACASPLAEPLKAAVTYTVTTAMGARGSLAVTVKAPGRSFELRDGSGTLLRTIDLAAPGGAQASYAVIDHDGAGGVVATGYQCSAVTTTPNVTLSGQSAPLLKRTVTLTSAQGVWHLSWYVVQDGKGAGTGVVPRVELVSDQAGAGTTVFAAP